jgi:uncharacterized membrane protein
MRLYYLNDDPQLANLKSNMFKPFERELSDKTSRIIEELIKKDEDIVNLININNEEHIRFRNTYVLITLDKLPVSGEIVKILMEDERKFLKYSHKIIGCIMLPICTVVLISMIYLLSTIESISSLLSSLIIGLIGIFIYPLLIDLSLRISQKRFKKK